MSQVWLWIDTLSGTEFLVLLVAVAIVQFWLVSLAAALSGRRKGKS